jgi:hypothetical protein
MLARRMDQPAHPAPLAYVVLRLPSVLGTPLEQTAWIAPG